MLAQSYHAERIKTSTSRAEAETKTIMQYMLRDMTR